MSHYELINVQSLTPIAVSDLSNISFVENEILSQIEDKRVRLTNLSKALSFGSSSLKGKTSLVFDTLTGQIRTEAVVVAFDNNFVWLDGNIKLPILALRSVDFV
ncbi:MAG: hypothetical protein NTU43_10285 [Bacteroidetes bacterium]|nr:hypothetical protein [Bacteroidota bacterium]